MVQILIQIPEFDENWEGYDKFNYNLYAEEIKNEIRSDIDELAEINIEFVESHQHQQIHFTGVDYDLTPIIRDAIERVPAYDEKFYAE